MPKTRRAGESRAEREARAEQYELPAMAAGLVLGHLETIERLADAADAMLGPNAYTARIRCEARAARDDVRDWQRRTSERLDYPYRRAP